MAKRDKPKYEPPEAQLRLFPNVSGNAVNGLGETERRRPSPVYWHYSGDLPHQALQDYYLRQFESKPELRGFETKFGGRGSREPPSRPDSPVIDAPERWSARIKEFALANEADYVGIAAVDRSWVFEGHEVRHPWIVVIGVEMDHARLATAPEIESVVEVMTQYNRGTRAARALGNFIQAQGYGARPHGGPMAGPILLIPAAIACGMGELGKHGSLINPECGSSLRLAGVLTDLPLVPDRPVSFGVDDFCASCRVCASACPPEAISHDKQWVRGERKWYVDFDKCIPYFNDTQGCGVCIAVCPWSRPGIAPRLAEKMSRRRANASRAS